MSGSQEKTPPTSPSAPATFADITIVINKLDTMQKENSSIKKQLNDIQKSFQTKIDTVEKKISDLTDKTELSIKDNKKETKEIQSKIEAVEEALTFQGNHLEAQTKEFKKQLKTQETNFEKRLTALEKKDAELEKELQKMYEKNLDMERHVRKYNLLLYGIPEENQENIYKKVKFFLRDEAKLSEEHIDQMEFQNAHRLPTKGLGPKPIIVRFVRWADREAVYNQVFKGVLAKGKNIATDLPPVLKAERFRLQQEAYKLRKGVDKLKTRVVEKGNSVILQTRKDNTESWKIVNV